MRLIDADAIKYTARFTDYADGRMTSDAIVTKDEIDELPTIDVPDRKVGKWIYEPVYKQTMDGKTLDGYTYCSECREMRPIDADALVDQLSDKAKEMLGIADQCQGQAINYYEGAKYGFAKAAIIANGFPTIEPKRGKWVLIERREPQFDLCGTKTWAVAYRCSECGFIHTVIEDFGHYAFCPNCGAKMEMERSEDATD